MVTENKIKIPDNHKRSLSATARHIENSINNIEELLTNKRKNKLTEKVIKSVDDEIRDKILELINLIRIKNESMFNDLELIAYNSYEDRIIRSNIGHIWTLLCDGNAKVLERYGNLSNQQSALINFHIESLLETINKLQSIIK